MTDAVELLERALAELQAVIWDLPVNHPKLARYLDRLSTLRALAAQARAG